MKQIRWKPRALRQVRKIKDSKVREQLYDSVDGLKSFPGCAGVKKIKSSGNYRLRVGNWRIIFSESLCILYIEEVKKRDERTYRSTNY